METSVHGERVWRFLCRVVYPVLKHRLGLEMEPLPAQQPVMLVCNHVTDMDPVLIAMASPKHALTYVASEHILREKPFLRRLLIHFFSPIFRRKATSAVDTCRKTVRAIREGKTVCLFAEGETTWNGATAPVQPGTAVLVKAAGVPLVTYRFHGSYFAAPRWGRGLRRGKITGHVTGFWTAETLKSMTAEEVTVLIEEGIREDAFGAQHEEKVPYKVRKNCRLAQIDALLFLCPHCKNIGTLRGQGDLLTCSCGLKVRVDACMLPTGEAPFPDFGAWDAWQTDALRERVDTDRLFRLEESRSDLKLIEIFPDGTVREAAKGTLSMDRDALRVGELSLSPAEIRDMATLQNRKLAISLKEHYYELQAPEALCLRKYLLFWRELKKSVEGTAGEEA